MANKWGLLENQHTVETLFKNYAQTNTTFLIIGCNLDTRKKLETLANDCQATVKLIDYVQSPIDLAEYYACSNVFVNLTHVDTLPTVNMESICCGTPVVTFNSGGSPELVLPNCGFVVTRGDDTGLINSIEKTKTLNREYIGEIGKKSFDAQINFKK